MTVGDHFDSWREAYDYACCELSSDHYRDWGWAVVEKCDGQWWAWIA